MDALEISEAEKVKPNVVPYKSKAIFLLAANAALGSFFFGYVLAVFNPTQKFIQDNVYPNIPKHLIYFMTSFVSLGSAFGAFAAGALASRYGRRRTMILTDIIAIFGVFLTIITNEYALLIGRLITGVCLGLNSSLVGLYIAEISPIEMKGYTGVLPQIFLSLGVNTSYLLGLNVPIGHENPTSEWWRFMLGVTGITPIIRLVTLMLVFDFETPKFLVIKGSDEQAKDVLSRIYKENYVEEAFKTLKEEFHHKNVQGNITYKELFSQRIRKRFFVGCVLAILQQACGNNAITSYSTEIFRRGASNVSSHTPQIYTVFVGLLSFTSAIMAAFLVRQTGRKKMLTIGMSILSTALILLSITGFLTNGSIEISKYFIFMYVLGFGFSLGSLTSLYLSEILPDIAIGIAMFLNWISCFCVLEVYPYLSEELGDSGAFFVFSGVCLLGLAFVVFNIKETKNKSPIEIAEMFARESDDEEVSEDKTLVK